MFHVTKKYSMFNLFNPSQTDRGPLGPRTHSSKNIYQINERFVSTFFLICQKNCLPQNAKNGIQLS